MSQIKHCYKKTLPYTATLGAIYGLDETYETVAREKWIHRRTDTAKFRLVEGTFVGLLAGITYPLWIPVITLRYVSEILTR